MSELITKEHYISLASAVKNNTVVFTGATSAVAGASGLVPAPNAGDNDKFLRADGLWSFLTIGSTSSTVEGAFWLEDDV